MGDRRANLNDAQELRFGRQELVDALRARADAAAPTDSNDLGPDYTRAVLLRSVADHLIPTGFITNREWHTLYATCFCEHGDLLSQWRGYGAGGGFAIGFSRQGLDRSEIDRDPRIGGVTGYATVPLQLVPIAYGTDAIAPMVERVVKTVDADRGPHPGSRGWVLARDIALPRWRG